jgi:hypothetical protein
MDARPPVRALAVSTDIADSTTFAVLFKHPVSGINVCGYALDLRGTTLRDVADALASRDPRTPRVRAILHDVIFWVRADPTDPSTMTLTRVDTASFTELARLWGRFVRLERFFADSASATCSACNADRAPLRCARCLVARYCNQSCQAADWAVGHKNFCDQDHVFVKGFVSAGLGGSTEERAEAFDSFLELRSRDATLQFKTRCENVMVRATLLLLSLRRQDPRAHAEDAEEDRELATFIDDLNCVLAD